MLLVFQIDIFLVIDHPLVGFPQFLAYYEKATILMRINLLSKALNDHMLCTLFHDLFGGWGLSFKEYQKEIIHQ